MLLCGCPGSGKSTYGHKIWNTPGQRVVYISRDDIRQKLRKPGDDYFAREDDVLKVYWATIEKSIVPENDVVIIDSTNLSPKSREQILKILTKKKYEIDMQVFYFQDSLAICIARNERRLGDERVPIEKLKAMYYRFTPFTNAEKAHFRKVTFYGVIDNIAHPIETYRDGEVIY